MVSYGNFGDFLQKQNIKSIKIKFSEIEDICKGRLPHSAYLYHAWWSNSDSHPLMKVVLSKSWFSSDLDLKNQTVRLNKGRTQKPKMKNNYKKEKIHINSRPILDLKNKPANTALVNDYDFISDNKKILFHDLLNEFVKEISLKKIEVYNEASIQHELALLLRKNLNDYKVQFERNVSAFGLNKQIFVKKEIDLVIFKKDKSEAYAIEIKFPRQKAYPNQMLMICEDIKFLEQLKNANFTKCFFLAFADDGNFWNDKGGRTIYQKFRKEKRLEGKFEGKINGKHIKLNFDSSYRINWKSIDECTRYFLVTV